ncbi:MAG: SDR family NAD(P)-dependent oxidoreductase [Planktomarina sp.]
MKRACIIGHTGGIGKAVSHVFADQGWHVDGLARSAHWFDLRRPETFDDIMSKQKGPYDLILMATGALDVNANGPEKTVKAIDPAAMADQFAINAIGPAILCKHAPRLLPKDRQSVLAVLTARVGSIGDNRLGGWIGYRSAKAAANQIVRTTAIELSRTHPQNVCIALHPGTVATQFTAKYLDRHAAVPPSVAAENIYNVLTNLDQGDTGQFMDYAGRRIEW